MTLPRSTDKPRRPSPTAQNDLTQQGHAQEQSFAVTGAVDIEWDALLVQRTAIGQKAKKAQGGRNAYRDSNRGSAVISGTFRDPCPPLDLYRHGPARPEAAAAAVAIVAAAITVVPSVPPPAFCCDIYAHLGTTSPPCSEVAAVAAIVVAIAAIATAIVAAAVAAAIAVPPRLVLKPPPFPRRHRSRCLVAAIAAAIAVAPACSVASHPLLYLTTLRYPNQCLDLPPRPLLIPKPPPLPPPSLPLLPPPFPPPSPLLLPRESPAL
ncbi:hypothetical protein B0H14DRAFT_3488289 [Mycena olivaceomarginata]|nr:hypothetical protein B0H14DRAFT_3488289 [Mycena olivaceomarginata]